jgi:hypothetical protein
VRVYTASVVRLLDALDAALRHGLREPRYRLFESGAEPPSYWPCVAKKTFPRNVDYIQAIAASRTGLDRGRAWLALALSESALQTYFQQFAQDTRLVQCAPNPSPHHQAPSTTHTRARAQGGERRTHTAAATHQPTHALWPMHTVAPPALPMLTGRVYVCLLYVCVCVCACTRVRVWMGWRVQGVLRPTGAAGGRGPDARGGHGAGGIG